MVLYGSPSFGALARLKISVSEDGLYTPVALIYSRADNGKCSGYLCEYDAALDEPGEIIAEFPAISTNSGVMGVDAGSTVEVQMTPAPVFLEAGEYIFQWQNTSRDTSAGEWYRSGMNGLRLDTMALSAQDPKPFHKEYRVRPD